MSHFYLIFFRLNFFNFRVKKGQTKNDPDDPERPFYYSVGRMGHSGSSGSFFGTPNKNIASKDYDVETF